MKRRVWVGCRIDPDRIRHRFVLCLSGAFSRGFLQRGPGQSNQGHADHGCGLAHAGAHAGRHVAPGACADHARQSPGCGHSGVRGCHEGTTRDHHLATIRLYNACGALLRARLGRAAESVLNRFAGDCAGGYPSCDFAESGHAALAAGVASQLNQAGKTKAWVGSRWILMGSSRSGRKTPGMWACM